MPLGQRRRDAVVQVCTDKGCTCTGTLVTPKLVLTAIHCVDDEDEVPQEVRFGADDGALTSIAVVGCDPHPWGLENVRIERCNTRRRLAAELGPLGVTVDPFRRFDVAALELAERVEHDRTIQPRTREKVGDLTGNYPAAPIPVITSDPLGDLHFWEGRTARVVGWGREETGSYPSRRQFREQEITEVGAIPPVRLNNRIGAPIVFTRRVSGRGDSGGALYLGHPSSLRGPRLLGVTWGVVDRLVRDDRSGYVLLTQPEVQSWLQPIVDRPGVGPVDIAPVPETDRPPLAHLVDPDGDGLIGANDNCEHLFNPIQRDGDRDGRGDKCDACGDEVVDPSLPDRDAESCDTPVRRVGRQRPARCLRLHRPHSEGAAGGGLTRTPGA